MLVVNKSNLPSVLTKVLSALSALIALIGLDELDFEKLPDMNYTPGNQATLLAGFNEVIDPFVEWTFSRYYGLTFLFDLAMDDVISAAVQKNKLAERYPKHSFLPHMARLLPLAERRKRFKPHFLNFGVSKANNELVKMYASLSELVPESALAKEVGIDVEIMIADLTQMIWTNIESPDRRLRIDARLVSFYFARDRKDHDAMCENFKVLANEDAKAVDGVDWHALELDFVAVESALNMVPFNKVTQTMKAISINAPTASPASDSSDDQMIIEMRRQACLAQTGMLRTLEITEQNDQPDAVLVPVGDSPEMGNPPPNGTGIVQS